MSTRKSPRWMTGTWAGLEQFRCTHCAFDTLDRGAMVQHARESHPREWEGEEEVAPLDGVVFASGSAEALATERGLTSSDFTGEPTGKTGYTLADVRRFAPAANSIPEE